MTDKPFWLNKHGTHRRLQSCVENWPNAMAGEYNPACCRFPKSCSVTLYSEEHITEDDLEPEPIQDLIAQAGGLERYDSSGTSQKFTDGVYERAVAEAEGKTVPLAFYDTSGRRIEVGKAEIRDGKVIAHFDETPNGKRIGDIVRKEPDFTTFSIGANPMELEGKLQINEVSPTYPRDHLGLLREKDPSKDLRDQIHRFLQKKVTDVTDEIFDKYLVHKRVDELKGIIPTNKIMTEEQYQAVTAAYTCTCPWNMGSQMPINKRGHHVACPELKKPHWINDDCNPRGHNDAYLEN